MSNVIDMTGLQIGRWRVIKQAPSDKRGQAMWVCQCACSNNTISVVRGADLRSGKSLSCGCLHNELLSDIRSTHKKTGTRLYVIWKNMRQRCYNSNHPAYKNYGGRGVSVCQEWNSFDVFGKWALENGYNDSLSIDRIDCDGDYNPQNCRWADNSVQSNNRRCNHYITIGDDTLSLSEWCKKLGKVYGTVRSRINKLHWSPEEALEIVGRGDVV